MAPAGGIVGQVGLCFDVTAYQDGEAEAEQSARHMIALLQQTRLIAVVLDTQGRVQFSNGGLCRLLDYGGAELMDCRLFEQHLADRDRDLLATLYPGGTQNPHFPTEFESELCTHTKEPRYVSWHTVLLRDISGRIKSTILIGDDVTQLRLTEQQFSLSSKIFEATHHAMVITDLGGTIVAVNNAFTMLTGYSEAEALGRNPSLLQSGRHDQAFYRQLWEQLVATGYWHGDIWDRRKDGRIYPKYLSISVIKDGAGKPTHYAGLFCDISERKTVEERLDYLAHYDALTGIPNRCLLLDRLEQEAERSTRQQTKLGLLYLDLDHFKQVNDSLGHAAGDELLKEVALRLKTCVRAVDTVARLGGDEFVVLISDIKEHDDLARVSTKMLNALMVPCKIEGESVLASPSIGISIYPDDCSDVHDLLKHADTAMYRVKQSGRGFYKFFSGLDR
jgi:diguanylate cyclase (GGDEF)-like protein/PAS domain S-box-containing protein